MDSRYLHPDVGDIYSQLSKAMEQPTYDSVIFESDKPVLESELNEMQAISNANIKNISAICAGGECALVLAPNASFSCTFEPSNDNNSNYLSVFIDNGFILHRGHLIRLTSNQSKHLFSLTINDTINNTYYLNIDWDDEPLIDDRVSIETTKRRKYKMTLSTTSDDTSIEFAKVEGAFKFLLPIIDLRPKNNVVRNPLADTSCNAPFMIGRNLYGDSHYNKTKIYMGEFNDYNEDDLFEFGVGSYRNNRNIVSWTKNSFKITTDKCSLTIRDNQDASGNLEFLVGSGGSLLELICGKLDITADLLESNATEAYFGNNSRKCNFHIFGELTIHHEGLGNISISNMASRISVLERKVASLSI